MKLIQIIRIYHNTKIHRLRENLIRDILVIHKKSKNEYEILLRLHFIGKRTDIALLKPSLNLLFATEESGIFTHCSVSGNALYTLSHNSFNVVCLADPIDKQEKIESLLKEVLTLIESKDVQAVKNEKERLQSEISPLVMKDSSSLMAQELVREIAETDEGQRFTKIVLVGLSEAGKTSLYKTFFEKASPESLSGLQPTILRSTHHQNVMVAKDRLTLVDLGGQSEFLPLHLQEKEIFTQANALIFVVDLQNPSRFEEAGRFFSQVVETLDLDQKPSCSLLLHKSDPEIRYKLYPKLKSVIKTVGTVLKPLEPTYFFTSVFERDSIDQAFSNTLFRALPLDVLEQTFTSEILLTAFKKIIPMYEKTIMNKGFSEKEVNQTLKEMSTQIGSQLAKNLVYRWYQSFSKGIDLPIAKHKPLVKVEYESVVRLELRCPISEARRKPVYCWVTHGIFEGVAKMLGLGAVERIRTMAQDNAPFCLFFAKYKNN